MKLILFVIAMTMSFQSMASLVVYTDRPTDRVKTIGELYEKNGGEPIQIIELSGEEIIEKAKDPNTVADVFFVKDAVYLEKLKSQNALENSVSNTVANSVSPIMRDSAGFWTFVSVRARTLIYNTGIDVSDINTYEDLAKKEMAGTLCLRQGKNVYNVALVAGLIADYGSTKAKDILSGILSNRVQPISYPSDTAVIAAIATSECSMGIAHSYYLGSVLAKQPLAPVAIKYLNMSSGGVHMDGTGVGVAKNSGRKTKAQEFVNFLVSNDEVQTFITNSNFEFPVKKGLVAPTVVKDFGPMNPTDTNWSSIGPKSDEALELINILGYE